MMRRRRLGVGAELASLVLILACLAGSFGLIVATYRRVNVARNASPRKPPVVALAPVPAPISAPKKPARTPDAVEPPPPPAEDPTPKALAKLTSAEAEQLLEASRANRQAQALDEARQAAVAESERWRRRQSLIHSQIDTMESKVRKVEIDLDAMAFERDALEKELDARKAAAARNKSRPSQAILPHKGPNGTWRRPIVVECRNGAAVIQPQGAEFGILELESGYGTTNRFVAAVAREAMRIQRSASPDGAAVVPYIFFLVRPDGIRPYYEARGRLEPLGITFGYELADSDWEIEFPNLDDVATWDGSAPADGANPVLTGTSPRSGGATSAEDTDLPIWPGSRPGGGNPAGPFTFGGNGNGNGKAAGPIPRLTAIMGRSLSPGGAAGSGLSGPGGSGSGGLGGSSSGGAAPTGGPPPAGFPASLLAGGEGTRDDGSGDTRDKQAGAGDRPAAGAGGNRVTASGRIISGAAGGGSGSAGGPLGKSGLAAGNPLAMAGGPEPLPGKERGSQTGDRPAGSAEAGPFELALDGPTADSLPVGDGGKPTPGDHSSAPGELTLEGPTSAPSPGTDGPKPDEPDPASTFVWPGGPNGDGKRRPSIAPVIDPTLDLPTTTAGDPTAPAHGGGGSAGASGAKASGGGDRAARRVLGQASPSGQPAGSPSNPPPPGAVGIGLNAPAMPPPPMPSPSSLPNIPPPTSLPPLPMNLPIPNRLPTPAEAAAAVTRQTNAPPNLADWAPHGSIVDRTFEIVVVCGPRGVIVQPGNYRVTIDALKDHEGLFKKQVVALVKNRRAADPKTEIEPRIRFLIQPQGFETYQAARSQFFVSGLNWPTTIQVANPDPLVIRSRGDW